MFDLSWGEVMVVGTIALLVIGPKDLPKALRTVGRMTAKVRSMAGEFQSQFSDAMREAELDDVRNQLKGVQSTVESATSGGFNPVNTIRDEIKGAIERPAAPAAAAAATTAAAGPTLGEAFGETPRPADPGLSLPAAPPVADPAAAFAPVSDAPAAAETPAPKAQGAQG